LFDLGLSLPELALIGVVALVVLGPERLPKLARTAGLWLGRARRFLTEVKRDIDQEIRSSELDALKDVGKDLRQAGDEFGHAVSDMKQGVEQSVETAAQSAEKPELLEAIEDGGAAGRGPAPEAVPAEHGKV
jgi:sec-independent protein translocase protein TatB